MAATRLSDQQWKFCHHYVQYGHMIRAVMAAYPDVKRSEYDNYHMARRLLKKRNIQRCVSELRHELRITQRTGIDQHLTQLANIRDKALAKGQMSAAAKAEELRGKVLGFYVQDIRVTHELGPNESLNRLRAILAGSPKIARLLPQEAVRRVLIDEPRDDQEPLASKKSGQSTRPKELSGPAKD
jgi:hypothetical protein